jgi:hypothetical protein
VRDIYSLPSDPNSLLFVATDRVFSFVIYANMQISAYDVILNNVKTSASLTEG